LIILIFFIASPDKTAILVIGIPYFGSKKPTALTTIPVWLIMGFGRLLVGPASFGAQAQPGPHQIRPGQ